MELAASNSRNNNNNSNHRDQISFPRNINFDHESENVDINFGHLMKEDESTSGGNLLKWRVKNKSALLSGLAIGGVSLALNCVVLLIFWLTALRQQLPELSYTQTFQPTNEAGKSCQFY